MITPLHKDWVSWIEHFLVFFILMKWSGIKWQWAVAIIIGIELDQAVSYTTDIYSWFLHTDTIMDILFGAFGIFVGYNFDGYTE